MSNHPANTEEEETYWMPRATEIHTGEVHEFAGQKTRSLEEGLTNMVGLNEFWGVAVPYYKDWELLRITTTTTRTRSVTIEELPL